MLIDDDLFEGDDESDSLQKKSSSILKMKRREGERSEEGGEEREGEGGVVEGWRNLVHKMGHPLI